MELTGFFVDISDDVCLELQNCRYFIYSKLQCIYVLNYIIMITYFVIKPETSDQSDRETCALRCHYL